MKKHILYTLAALAVGFSSMPIQAANPDPNRVIVETADNQRKAYRTDNVSQISFANVEGEVAAYVQVENVTL